MKLTGIPSYIITSLNPKIPFETEIYNLYPNISDKIVFFLIDGLGYDHLYDYRDCNICITHINPNSSKLLRGYDLI